MFSPLNSYAYIHWILDFKYILLFYVLNCWLNLATSCLDDENELSLKVIASLYLTFCSTINSFNGSQQLVTSVFWSKVSTKSLHFFFLCAFWMSLFSLGSSGEVGSLLRRSFRPVITSNISAGPGSSCVVQ